jgi:hypothetical protein
MEQHRQLSRGRHNGSLLAVPSTAHTSARTQQSSAQDVSTGPTPTSTQAIEPSSLSPVEPPPGPIIVNYQNRQLMIEARNSTLSSLLRAACYETRHSSRCTA